MVIHFNSLRFSSNYSSRQRFHICSNKPSKSKLKIGLINVCSLSAKNKDINKKADIREIFDDDTELDILVCTETNIDDYVLAKIKGLSN